MTDRAGRADSGGRVSPSREDAVVRSVSEAVGGPLGDHAGQHPWWTPLRAVLLLAAIAMSLGIAVKAPCLDIAGQADKTGRYASLCWSDTSTAYVANGHAEGYWPFTDDAQVRARYAPAWVPPLPAYAAFVSQRLTSLISGSPDLDPRAQVPVSEVVNQPGVLREARIFTLVSAVLMAAVGLLAAGLLTGVRRRRPWDAAAFAAAPVLVLFFSIGWDLIPAAAVAGALWGWSRGRLGVTGVAVGVGAAASPFVALLLVPAVAIQLRERQVPGAVRLAGAAAATWAAVMLPAFVSSPEAWRASWQAYFHGADIGSSWLLISQVGNWAPSVRTTLITTWFMLVLIAAVVTALARRGGWSFASLGTVMIAAALIVSPAAAPSYALVLLPLAVVAVRTWSSLLVWQACEIGHWAMLGFYLGGVIAPSAGGDSRAYWLGVLLRIGGLVSLIVAAASSADVDPIEPGRGEADPDVDVLTDVGHARA